MKSLYRSLVFFAAFALSGVCLADFSLGDCEWTWVDDPPGWQVVCSGSVSSGAFIPYETFTTNIISEFSYYTVDGASMVSVESCNAMKSALIAKALALETKRSNLEQEFRFLLDSSDGLPFGMLFDGISQLNDSQIADNLQYAASTIYEGFNYLKDEFSNDIIDSVNDLVGLSESFNCSACPKTLVTGAVTNSLTVPVVYQNTSGGSSEGSGGCPCSAQFLALIDALNNIGYKLDNLKSLIESLDNNVKVLKQFVGEITSDVNDIRKIGERWDDYLEDDLKEKISRFDSKWVQFPTNFFTYADFLTSSNWVHKVTFGEDELKDLKDCIFALTSGVFTVRLADGFWDRFSNSLVRVSLDSDSISSLQNAIYWANFSNSVYQFESLTNFLSNTNGGISVSLSSASLVALRDLVDSSISSNSLYQFESLTNFLSNTNGGVSVSLSSRSLDSLRDLISSNSVYRFSSLTDFLGDSGVSISSNSLFALEKIVNNSTNWFHQFSMVTNFFGSSPFESLSNVLYSVTNLLHCNYREPFISLSYSNANYLVDQNGDRFHWLDMVYQLYTPNSEYPIDFSYYESLNWFSRIEFLLGHIAGVFSSTNSISSDFTQEQKEQIEEVSENSAWSADIYDEHKGIIEGMIRKVSTSVSSLNPFRGVFSSSPPTMITIFPETRVENILIPERTIPAVTIQLSAKGDGNFSLHDFVFLSHNITTFLAFVFFAVFDILAIIKFVRVLISINAWYWKIYHSWVSTMFNGGGR